jgi:hypothetical protein
LHSGVIFEHSLKIVTKVSPKSHGFGIPCNARSYWLLMSKVAFADTSPL